MSVQPSDRFLTSWWALDSSCETSLARNPAVHLWILGPPLKPISADLVSLEIEIVAAGWKEILSDLGVGRWCNCPNKLKPIWESDFSGRRSHLITAIHIKCLEREKESLMRRRRQLSPYQEARDDKVAAVKNYFCAADYLQLPKFSLTNWYIFRENIQILLNLLLFILWMLWR